MSTTPAFRVRSLANETLDWTGEDDVLVTNCDTEGCELAPRIIFDPVTKIPMEYTCAEALGDNPYSYNDDAVDANNTQGMTKNASETLVSVDYEALLPMNANAEYNVRQLQWRVLLAAVQEVGLDRCNFNKQRGNRQRRRLQQQRQQGGLIPSLTIYAIENDFELSAAYQNPCRYLRDDSNSLCLPVRTVLRLKYDGDYEQAQVVQAYVKNLLKRTMVDYTDELLVGDVTALQYVGTHDFSGLDGLPTGSSSINDPQHLGGDGSVVKIAGYLISTASAVILLSMLLFFRRRRQREDIKVKTSVDEHQKDGSRFTHELHDVESGSTHGYPAIGVTTMSGLSTDDHSSSNSANPSDDSSDVVSPTNSVASDDAYVANENDLLMDNDISSIFRSISSESSSMDGAPSNLPPRIPLRSTNSAPRPTSSKRILRRKKKKRSKTSLKRTTSRECIQAMEAIPEVFGDDDDSGSDEGSEYYSSSDEDGATSSHQSSSGYNTPVGPDSQSGSPNTRSRFPSDPDSADAQRILDSLNYHLGVGDDTVSMERASTFKTSNGAKKSQPKRMVM